MNLAAGDGVGGARSRGAASLQPGVVGQSKIRHRRGGGNRKRRRAGRNRRGELRIRGERHPEAFTGGCQPFQPIFSVPGVADVAGDRFRRSQADSDVGRIPVALVVSNESIVGIIRRPVVRGRDGLLEIGIGERDDVSRSRTQRGKIHPSFKIGSQARRPHWVLPPAETLPARKNADGAMALNNSSPRAESNSPAHRNWWRSQPGRWFPAPPQHRTAH